MTLKWVVRHSDDITHREDGADGSEEGPHKTLFCVKPAAEQERE
jgi:hypothetical protein